MLLDLDVCVEKYNPSWIWKSKKKEEKDQKERDLNKKWYGYVYRNINSERIDAQNLFKLILEGKGSIK